MKLAALLRPLVFSLVLSVSALWVMATNPAQEHADSAHANTAARTEGKVAHGTEPEHKLNVKDILLHHVMDSHEWHITDVPGAWVGSDHRYVPIALHLPYIMWNSEKGLEVFSIHGHTDAEKQASAAEHGYSINNHGHLHPLNHHVTAIDFSITKNVLHMLIVSTVLLFVFVAVAGAATRRKGQAPTGMQNFFEPIVVFIRDEVAKPNMHGKHAKFVPYLLTIFFFIWFANLLGLTPFNSNIAGNTAFTAAMAMLTFIIVQFNGTKDYWQHVFWYPGVPLLVKFIMLPVELIGLFTKPFALTVRLFANIAGGHFMVLSLVCLIFILNSLKGVGAAVAITPLSLVFTLFIMAVELIVAIVQAYVFTLLTAVFIGQAMETHHHEDHHEAHAH